MNQPSLPGMQGSHARPIPWLVWAFLVGAVAQLVVQVAPDSYQVFGPYFLVDAGMVIDWISSISPFVLAATVVLAADRWPSGRVVLLIGASVLAVGALARMGVDLWWVLFESTGGLWDVTSPWLSAGSLGGAFLLALAHAVLAAGLWSAAPTGQTTRRRVAVMVAIALGGTAAFATALWSVVQAAEMIPTDSRAYAIAIAALLAAGFAALAFLAIAAVRASQRPDGMPEYLVALGAVLAMAASAWAWIFSNLVPLQEVSEQAFLWVFTLPHLAGVVGWLTMIAGFGLAALGLRRASGVHLA